MTPSNSTKPTPAEANRLFYAAHAEQYDSTEYCVNAELGRRRLVRTLDPVLSELDYGDCVLDAGGGSGNVSEYLVKRGFSPVLVDVSAEMIALWKAKAARFGFEPEAELCALEEFFELDQRRWHLIVFSSVLHHLERPDALLAQAAQRLEPGGFIVTVFDPVQIRRATGLRKLDYLLWLASKSPRDLARVAAVRLRRSGGSETENIGAIAEYHAMTGIDDRALVGGLVAGGLELVAHERYHDARFALVRGIARLIRTSTAFSMVLRAPGQGDI